MRSTNKSIFALLTIAFCIAGFVACENPQPPAQVLSVEEANQLEDEFISTRYRVINEALNIQDTRDFWFSLDSLKKYIEFVEFEAKKRGHNNLGIRVYFAAYPENSNYPEAGFSTVFMVPTAEANRTGVKGFMPMEPLNQNIDSIPAFNYGQGGQPPNGYE